MGQHWVCPRLINGTIVFNADATSALADGIDPGIEHANGVVEVEAVIPDDPATSAQTFTASISCNVSVVMSNAEGDFTTTLKGCTPEDNNMLIGIFMAVTQLAIKPWHCYRYQAIGINSSVI